MTNAMEYRLYRAIQGAHICINHWVDEGDAELVADAEARMSRLQRLYRGETDVYRSTEAMDADIDGAIDWLDSSIREEVTAMTREQHNREQRAHRMADTLRWYADDPDTDAICGEGYSDELRALADRLDDGTATDDDWIRALDELDPRI